MILVFYHVQGPFWERESREGKPVLKINKF